MKYKLNGRTVLLTGATGGIGAAIAEALHQRQADLVLTGRRVDLLDTLADRYGARTIAADLSERTDVERLVADAGEVDVLIANAAMPPAKPVLEHDADSLNSALAVNVLAPMILSRAVGAQMVARGSGRIVLISSVAGRLAPPEAVYSATKFALCGFASGLRQELHGTGVGVSVVLPGFVRDAGMFAESGAKLPAPVRSWPPRKVARAVVRAIERNKAEVVAAPPEIQFSVAIGGLAPGISASVQRRLLGNTMRQVSDGLQPQQHG